MYGKREIILLRHGEAEHLVGAEPLTGGWTDTKLTEKGRAQALLTGKALALESLGEDVRFWCSDLVRARETADLIGACIGKVPVLAPDLREFNNGMAAGLTKSAAEAIANPLEGHVGDWRPYDGGENWREFMLRVNRFADAHLATGSHLVVCHSGTAFNLLFWFLGLEQRYVGQVYTEIAPCGMTRLGISPYGERTIRCLNDRYHLAGLEVGGASC